MEERNYARELFPTFDFNDDSWAQGNTDRVLDRNYGSMDPTDDTAIEDFDITPYQTGDTGFLWEAAYWGAMAAGLASPLLPTPPRKNMMTVGHGDEFKLSTAVQEWASKPFRYMFGSNAPTGVSQPSKVNRNFPGMEPTPRSLTDHGSQHNEIITPDNARAVLSEDAIAQRNRAQIAMEGRRRPNTAAGRPSVDAIDDYAASQSAAFIPHPNWSFFFGMSQKSQDDARRIMQARTFEDTIKGGRHFRAMEERAEMASYLAKADPAFAEAFTKTTDPSLLGMLRGRKVDNPVVPYPQTYSQAFDGARTQKVDMTGRMGQLKGLARTGHLGGRHASQVDALSEASFYAGDYFRTGAWIYGAFVGGSFMANHSEFHAGEGWRAFYRKSFPDEEHNESFYYDLQTTGDQPRSDIAQEQIGHVAELHKAEVYGENARFESAAEQQRYEETMATTEPLEFEARVDVARRTLENKPFYHSIDQQTIDEGKVHPILARTEARNRTEAWQMQDELQYMFSEDSPDFVMKKDDYISMAGHEAWEGKQKYISGHINYFEGLARTSPASYLLETGATEGRTAQDWEEFLWSK